MLRVGLVSILSLGGKDSHNLVILASPPLLLDDEKNGGEFKELLCIEDE